jgi:hypothetical protein
MHRRVAAVATPARKKPPDSIDHGRSYFALLAFHHPPMPTGSITPLAGKRARSRGVKLRRKSSHNETTETVGFVCVISPPIFRIYATTGVLEFRELRLSKRNVHGVTGMSVQPTDRPATIVPFAHTPKGNPDANIIADDSGRAILAMLKKAAEQANEDCARAMNLAHKLTFQVRDLEERFRQLELEAAQFRDRATHAEAWLLRIQNDIEDTFFQSKERDPRQRQQQ